MSAFLSSWISYQRFWVWFSGRPFSLQNITWCQDKLCRPSPGAASDNIAPKAHHQISGTYFRSPQLFRSYASLRRKSKRPSAIQDHQCNSWNIIAPRRNKIPRALQPSQPMLNPNTQKLRNHISPLSLLAMISHCLRSFSLISRSQVASENSIRILIPTEFQPQPMVVFQSLHTGIYSRVIKWLPTKAMISRPNIHRTIICSFRRLCKTNRIKTTGHRHSILRRNGQSWRSRLSVFIKVSVRSVFWINMTLRKVEMNACWYPSDSA